MVVVMPVLFFCGLFSSDLMCVVLCCVVICCDESRLLPGGAINVWTSTMRSARETSSRIKQNKLVVVLEVIVVVVYELYEL
jgi:hypothetical protein